MIPVLYEYGKTSGIGLGKLVDTISCEVYEELNGEYELTFEYPITGALYNELLTLPTIHVEMPTIEITSGGQHTYRGREIFDIYKKSLPIDGVVTFYASHFSRRFSRSVFTATSFDPSHIQNFYDYITPSMGRYVNSTLEPAFSSSVSVPDPQSALALLIGDEHSLISEIGGDIAFYFNSSFNSTPCFTWLAHRGADRGASIRYAYNMTDIDHTIDNGETFNALVPYYTKSDGTRIFVAGTNPLYKIVQPSTPLTPVKAVPMDCTEAFQTQPTGAQLTQYAQDWLDANMPWLGSEELTVDFVNGTEIDPHGAPVYLGDTVHVYWGDAQVSADLRCVSYKYDVLAERYTEIKLGKPQTNFVSVTGIDGGSAASESGGGLTATELYTASSYATPFALSDNVQNYDFLVVYCGNNSYYFSTIVIPTYDLGYVASTENAYVHFSLSGTTGTIIGRTSGFFVTGVYGFKYTP